MNGLRPRQVKAIEDVRAAYRDDIISIPIHGSHCLAAVFRVSPWGVSAGTRRSANMRKHERHTKGFLFEVVMAKIIDLAGKSFGRLTVIELQKALFTLVAA